MPHAVDIQVSSSGKLTGAACFDHLSCFSQAQVRFGSLWGGAKSVEANGKRAHTPQHKFQCAVQRSFWNTEAVRCLQGHHTAESVREVVR